MLKVCFSVDVEPDCVSYLKSFRGMEEGIHPLLDMLEEEGIKGTFFTTGQVAEMYPETIQKIVDRGHELGCHGYSHQRFMKMDLATAREEIQNSTKILRNFANVTSFRAPFLEFPDHFYPLLEEAHIEVDSSQAKYKRAYYRSKPETKVKRIPASVTSSILRLPPVIRNLYLSALASPVVLFVHPWEFVNLQKEKMRFDSRYRTGKVGLECVRDVLRRYKNRAATFYTIKKLAHALDFSNKLDVSS